MKSINSASDTNPFKAAQQLWSSRHSDTVHIMVSSSGVPDMGDFIQVETCQGNIMVAAELLTISSNTPSEEYSDIASCQSETMDGTTPPTPCVLSMPSSPMASQYDISPAGAGAGAELLQPVYPDCCTTSMGSIALTTDTERWPIDPQLFASSPLRQVQSLEGQSPDGVLPLSASDAASVPDCINSATLTHGVAMAAQPPRRPTSTQTSMGHDTSSGTLLDRPNEAPIPSYMSPEAIRARNLLLRCHLPSRRKKTGIAHASDYAAFAQAHHPSKRPKLNGDG